MKRAICGLVFLLTAALLVEEGRAEACLVPAGVKKQALQVWPAGEGVPVNARFQVRILAPQLATALPPADPLRLEAPGTGEGYPVDRLARALSLRTELPGGAPGAIVTTAWSAVIAPEAWTVELRPLAPLAPQRAYVVVLDRQGTLLSIARLRTGGDGAEAPPRWSGVLAARFVAARKEECLTTTCCSCCTVEGHGPQARFTVEPVVATGPHRFLVWLAPLEEPLRYDENPGRWAQQRDGELALDLPDNLARVARFRIGVRAADAAGNLSAPSEVQIAPPPR